MPDKLADGGGHSPQTLTGSLCFQDRPGAVVQFTIHKNGYPGENRTRGLFLRREALLVLLSYGIMKLVEVEGIAPTRSILQGLAVPMTVTPKCYRQELHPHLRR